MKYLKRYNEDFKNKREFVLLIGPPASGKSTYIKSINRNKEYIVINRDEIAIDVAERNGLTYKDMFVRPNLVMGDDREFIKNVPEYYEKKGKRFLRGFERYGEIVELPDEHYMKRYGDLHFSNVISLNDEVSEEFDKRFNSALNSNKSIIIDMVNINKKNRKLILDRIDKDDFIIKAVVFNNGGKGYEDIIIKNNRERDKELKKFKREKSIPDFVIKSFIDRYEIPSDDEGIDDVEYFNIYY